MHSFPPKGKLFLKGDQMAHLHGCQGRQSWSGSGFYQCLSRSFVINIQSNQLIINVCLMSSVLCWYHHIILFLFVCFWRWIVISHAYVDLAFYYSLLEVEIYIFNFF